MILWETYFAAGQEKFSAGAFDKAEDLFRCALSEAESCSPDEPRLLQTRLALIAVFQRSQRAEAASAMLAEAEAQVTQGTALPAPMVAEVLQARLEDLASRQATSQERLKCAAQLVKLWTRAGADHRGELLTSLLSLADLELEVGDRAGARATLEQALETALGQYGAKHAVPAAILTRLAEADLRSGDLESAERCARRALSTWQDAPGEGEAALAAALTLLAQVLERRKRTEEALALRQQAAELPGERRAACQLDYAAALLQAGQISAAQGLLASVDRGALDPELGPRFELYRMRASKSLGDTAAVRQEAERLALREMATPSARIEAFLELAEADRSLFPDRLHDYLETINELAQGDSLLEQDAQLLTRVAEMADSLSRKEIAESFYDRAIAARSQHLEASDPASVLVLYELGKIQERRRHLLDAASSWEKALESLRRHSGQLGAGVDERRLRFRLVWRLAEVYVRQQRWERAEQAWRSLVRSAAPSSPEQVRGRLGLVQVYTEQDQYRKALETLQADGGLEVEEAAFGREMSDAAFLLRLVNLTETRQQEEAKELLDRRFEARGAAHLTSIRELAAAVAYASTASDEELLLEVSEELASRRPQDVEEQLIMARFYALLARYGSKHGGRSERWILGLSPLQALNRAVHWAIEANGQPDLRVAELLEEKARAAVVQGAWEEAEEATRGALEMRRVLQGERSATLLPSLQRLGELQLGRGQLDEAVPFLEQALALAEVHLPARDSGSRELLRSLIEAHRRRGEFSQSRNYLTRLLDLYKKYEDLRPEEKLDDLLRGIRLLLGDERQDHRALLSDYLDEAMELAIARGEIAALSLAFCFGQKARLLLSHGPDQAVALLRRQAATLEGREEAKEFIPDQLLLARLLLFRGQPQSVLTLLDELERLQPFAQSRWELQLTQQLLEANAWLALEEHLKVGRNLDLLEEHLAAGRLPSERFRAEVLALQLRLYVTRPDLVGDEAATRAYAGLDRLVEELDWSVETAPHERRERWGWELARLRFETSRLAPEAALERLQDHIHRLREARDSSPLAMADSLALLAWQEEQMDRRDAALVHLDQALKLLEESGDTESLDRARWLQAFARISEGLQRYDLALGAYREAVGDLKAHLGSRHRDLIPLYLGLGRLNALESDHVAAESALLQALAIVEQDEAQLALAEKSQVLVDLAELIRRDGRLAESLELWKRVERLYSERSELLPTVWLESFLNAHIASGLEDQALDFFLAALSVRLQDDPEWVLLGLYAQWLELMVGQAATPSRWAQAQRLLEVRKVFEGALQGELSPECSALWARVLVGLARLQLRTEGEPPAEIAHDLDQALQLRERLEGAESAAVGEVLVLRAHLARCQNDLGLAETYLTRALNISETQVGAESWETAEILLSLAEVYFQKQKLSPTEALLQRVLELCAQLLDPDDPRWIDVYHLQGRLRLELGRPAEAFESLERAIGLSRQYGQPSSRALLVAAGRASLLTDRSELALEFFRQAEPFFPQDWSEWDAEVEEIVLILGELCLSRELYSETEQRLCQVLAAQEQRFGFGDPRLARVYRALGMASTGLNELDTAEERLEIALAFQEDDLFTPLDLYEPFLAVAAVHTREGRPDRATHLLQENLERCQAAERPEKVARLAELLARSQEARADLKSAEAAWRQAIDAWEEAVARSTPDLRPRLLQDLLAPLQSLSHLLLRSRRYTEAEELTKRRVKVAEMLDFDQPELADIQFDLAEISRHQGMFREASDLHQKVMAIKASELGRQHPEVARSVRALGQIALGEGKLDQAIALLEKALEQQSQALGESHPEVAETLFALGDTFLAQEDFRSSEERYRRALELLEQQYGARDIRTARGWTALAGLYEQRQQWSRAQPLLGKAVESVEAVLGPSHLDVADLLVKTAEVYLVSGAWDEVSDPLERALRIRTEKLGEEHPAVAKALKLKGELALAGGDVAGARRLFSRADQIISAHYGPESIERLPFRLALASSLRELEEYEQAHSHLTTLLTAGFWQGHRQRELAMAELQEELAKLELARGALPVAESFAKQVLDVRSRHLGPKHEGVASALETLARIHYRDGRVITAAALAERALEARSAAEAGAEGKASVSLGRARVLTLLAQIELEQSGLAKASELALEALHARRDLLGEEHPEVAASLHLLGEIAVAEKKLEKAESFFEQALERWERVYGVAHPAVFQAVTSLARLFAQQGRLTLAEQYHQRNLQALEGRYGADHPILGETLLGLGRLCRSQGNLAAAERHLKRAAELQTAVYGESDTRVASVLHTLALVYQDQRNFLAAEALLKKALQIRERLGATESEELSESHLALARLYRSSGKTLEAEPLLKKVLDWRSRRYGDNHPEVAALLREMAEIFADQKQYLKAQALIRRALDIYGGALGQRNVELVGPLRQLARILEAAGDHEEAEVQRQLARELMGADA